MNTLAMNRRYKLLENDGGYIITNDDGSTISSFHSFEAAKAEYMRLSVSVEDKYKLVQEAFFQIDKEIIRHDFDWYEALEENNTEDDYYEAAGIILGDFQMDKDLDDAYVDFHTNREDIWVSNIKERYGDNWGQLADKIILEGY